MDTRVLLANANKRYEAIFNGLGIISQSIAQTAQGVDAASEVIYNKLVEVDNKLDLIMAHLGLELLKPETPVDESVSAVLDTDAPEESL